MHKQECTRLEQFQKHEMLIIVHHQIHCMTTPTIQWDTNSSSLVALFTLGRIRVVIGTAGRLLCCSAWFADAVDFLVVIRITANAVQATSAWAAAVEFWGGSCCCCCCCCFLTLTDPLRIQPWSQDRRNQTKSNRESEMSMESRQKKDGQEVASKGHRRDKIENINKKTKTKKTQTVETN